MPQAWVSQRHVQDEAMKRQKREKAGRGKMTLRETESKRSPERVWPLIHSDLFDYFQVIPPFFPDVKWVSVFWSSKSTTRVDLSAHEQIFERFFFSNLNNSPWKKMFLMSYKCILWSKFPVYCFSRGFLDIVQDRRKNWKPNSIHTPTFPSANLGLFFQVTLTLSCLLDGAHRKSSEVHLCKRT